MSEVGTRRSRPEHAGSSKTGGLVRPYRPEDREAVRRICCETGFLGRPIEPLFADRELYADLMTGPYLDHEPEWAWVAESDGVVVGYLLASVRPDFDRCQLLVGARVTGRMLFRLITGRYANHPPSRRYIRWLILRSAMERPRRPRGAAHLHFNLLEGFRGRLGLLLWHTFDHRLRQAGIKDLYGEFFSFPGHRPEKPYSHIGFVPFDRRETTLFRDHINESVQIVCLHRRLPARSPSGELEVSGDSP
jgi:hypothetical protein